MEAASELIGLLETDSHDKDEKSEGKKGTS